MATRRLRVREEEIGEERMRKTEEKQSKESKEEADKHRC